MKRIALVLCIAGPMSAQWTVWDPTNYGINLNNLMQAQQAYQQMKEYKQMVENAAAFVRNPAQFMSQIAMIEQVALDTASRAGVSTQQKRDQLQKIIRAQQEAARHAQTIQTITHQNMNSIEGLATNMIDVSNQLAMANQQLAHESRVSFYQSRDSAYQPQAGLITSWRLK